MLPRSGTEKFGRLTPLLSHIVTPKVSVSVASVLLLASVALMGLPQVSLAISSSARPIGSAASAVPAPAVPPVLHQQMQQTLPTVSPASSPSAPISNGAQLFQSPAALAAAASASAATASSLSVQPSPMSSQAAPHAQQQPQPQQQQQHLNNPSSIINMLSPAMPQTIASAMSARVDTAELLKQQQQQVSSQQQQPINMEQECLNSGGFISFELITGYVLSAPAESMLMQPGTLQLTDCLNICRQNSSCLAINFETGLCVLLQESADKNPQALQKSQFPVFTIYAHKICLQGDRLNRCHKSWSFERIIGWVLNNLEKKTILTKTRLECLQACYSEQAFQCKSFNYDSASGSCQLSDLDRHSLASAALRRRHYVESTVDTIDYGENNCVQEARGICDFKPLQNRILKTVDSIYQDIKSEPECRKRCLQAPYRCHSYDLGDSSNPVCRTSHLDRNSLQQIQDPYLDIQGAVSYELDSCYNVTVVCKSREMVARVKTNKVFNGKIYAKNAPLSCVNDITNSMDFELSMAFNDACSISRSANSGLFTNEIVLQHNDMIVTNSDMGLNVKCQYDLRNQTVYNNINLDDFLSGREPIDIASQSAVVRSPNISMQILRHDGNHITQAQVGDSLLLRFQITDERSPFEIFVRDLYAMDGVGGTEIMLIDGEGCPTDPSILAAMTNAKGNGQTLESQFDAFKFPTSETVAFRALVTPCIPHCEPVHCQNRGYDGTLYEAESFGKRRRRKRSAPSAPSSGKQSKFAAQQTTAAAATVATSAAANQSPGPAEVVVKNSIEIKDKFFLDSESDSSERMNLKRTAYELTSDSLESADGRYLKLGGVALLFCGLLIAQSVLFVGWAMVWRKRYAAKAASLPSYSRAPVTVSVTKQKTRA